MKSFSKTLILIVVILLISQSFLTVFKTYETIHKIRPEVVEPTGKASASGTVSLCINTRPVINVSDCNANATQDVYYECWLNATDPDYTNLTYFSLFAVIERAFNDSNQSLFSVAQDGFISFTPTNNDVGNFTIQFTVNDGIGCSNSEDSTYFNLSVLNVNDAPVFIGELDDQTFSEAGQTIHAFYLDNHFEDPDLDPLTYTFAATSSAFSISISNATSGVVITANTCDVASYVLFIASDPYNATNTSNLVTLRCVSPEPIPDEGAGEGTGDGGGGGLSDICIPEYICYDYHKCNISNVKLQKCVDTEGCQDDVFLEVPCVYIEEVECNESWNCTDWGPCLPNGTQTRECIDLNDCGTNEFMPELIQECEYIGTCDDGIKNCHDDSCEEGVDCGGPCPVCKSIEVPYPFEEQRSLILYIVTGIILFLLTAVLLYHYFHKEINAALAKAGWIIKRRKKKQILLSTDDKKKLLTGIVDLEKKIGRIELFDILNKCSELFKYYLIHACAKGLSSEFELNDLENILKKKKRIIKGEVREYKVHEVEVLRKIFVSGFSKYLKIEQNKKLITKRNIVLLTEELKNIVLQTSETEPSDIARETKELKMPENASGIDKVSIKIINTYIALEFLELEVAKKKYLEILSEYEKLDLAGQEAIYEDITRLYHNISYVNTWLEKPDE